MSTKTRSFIVQENWRLFIGNGENQDARLGIDREQITYMKESKLLYRNKSHGRSLSRTLTKVRGLPQTPLFSFTLSIDYFYFSFLLFVCFSSLSVPPFSLSLSLFLRESERAPGDGEKG